ncbi:unnamed protein product [Prorocentrum cordatum]|uniref:Selenoprotein O n=1 Tax=Prorocentrum cordatum TaxID=2364126 RepID=A0ABN9W845_9DINO|nr:unnamed protein product [Polarella glacialis]
MRTWRWQDSVDSFSGGPHTVECFRDQPWLACSLGASPGGHSTAGPNPMELASQFPVIRQALASVQAEQQRAKENPELWPAAVSRDRAELQRRTRRRPPLDADLSTLRSVATGLSFRESAGTLLTKTR